MCLLCENHRGEACGSGTGGDRWAQEWDDSKLQMVVRGWYLLPPEMQKKR